MRTLQIPIALAIASCGGGQQISHSDDRGWAEHMAAADRHDRAAAQHERAASEADLRTGGERFQCGDPVLNDQLTTGGMRVTNWQPCFDIAEESAMTQHEAAAHERELARRDRSTAAALVRAEVAACSSIPMHEREHSPFAHRKAIAQVIPHRESGLIKGVRIVFKPVPGLDAAWLRQDLACQRARWAVLGEPYGEPGDPTLVDGAQVEVFDRGGHAEVLVTTETTEAGELALARAEGRLLAHPESLAGREHELPKPERRR